MASVETAANQPQVEDPQDVGVFAYLGRASCGCVRAIATDPATTKHPSPQYVRDFPREMSRWLRQGLLLERVPMSVARASDLHCPHQPPKAPLRQRRAALTQAGLGI
jgi:hypothetical protein